MQTDRAKTYSRYSPSTSWGFLEPATKGDKMVDAVRNVFDAWRRYREASARVAYEIPVGDEIIVVAADEPSAAGDFLV